MCNNETRKLSSLFKDNKTVYVYLSSKEICKLFYKNAQEEGFRFSDGVKPTHKRCVDLVAINKDRAMCFMGYISRIHFKREDCKILKIDYQKFIDGFDDYSYKKA